MHPDMRFWNKTAIVAFWAGRWSVGGGRGGARGGGCCWWWWWLLLLVVCVRVWCVRVREEGGASAEGALSSPHASCGWSFE